MTADAVVVGAGVIGASVAWHLASLGMRKVVILERAAPGAGSTGRATGGFRAQYDTEIHVRLSLLARDKLRRFRDELGVDPGYDPRGYLWLARTPGQLAPLVRAHAVQQACGLSEARILQDSEIQQINPAVRAEGLAGAAYCPTDGFVRPLEVLRGYLEGAQRLGVEVRHGANVQGFRRAPGGTLAAVVLSDGTDIATGCVVNAAGPWAAQVAALAGVDLPVRPLRRQVGATVPCAALPATMPMTIYVEDGFHLRVRDGRVLLLSPAESHSQVERDPFGTDVDPAWLREVARIAAERVPALSGVPIDAAHSWAGLYEMSPDGHALLGRAPGCANLFLANGSSGHGVMHAPALGQLLAELIATGSARTLDIAPLDPGRFAQTGGAAGGQGALKL